MAKSKLSAKQVDDLVIDDTELLIGLLKTANQVFIKKLSNNDRDWAANNRKHQGGVYIPHIERDSGFFPKLNSMKRSDPDAKEIRETRFEVLWPQNSISPSSVRLAHYTSKGQETHLTNLPHEIFRYLNPASYLVIAKRQNSAPNNFEALTIDSNSSEIEILQDIFDLPQNFGFGIFNPAEIATQKISRILDFSDKVFHAWQSGNLDQFAKANVQLPTTLALSKLANAEYLKKYSLKDTNPFELESPGDVLKEMSREIEFRLFREYQMRERSVELIKIVFGTNPRKIQAKDAIKMLIEKFAEVDALMVSAGNQRKSRAGYSYEHHIEQMLKDGAIPFDKQPIIEAKKRPDFILPNSKYLKTKSTGQTNGLILSAKTTLRERWKQVEREKGTNSLFLTTVDETIALNVIEEMATMGICLVVPESLIATEKRGKRNKYTEYSGHKNVMSFRSFCHEIIKPRLDAWNQ